MYKRKTNYDSHGFKDKQSLNLVLKKPWDREHQYMNPLLIDNMNYLEEHNIIKYLDFVKTLNKHNLKSNDIKDIMYGFVCFYNSSPSIDNEHQILWLKKRICQKSNSCEKNIILTRIVFQYKSKFLEYLNIYISLPDKSKKIEKPEKFISEFNNMIQCVFDQSQEQENKDYIQANDINIDNQEPNTINGIEIPEINNLYENENKKPNYIYENENKEPNNIYENENKEPSNIYENENKEPNNIYENENKELYFGSDSDYFNNYNYFDDQDSNDIYNSLL